MSQFEVRAPGGDGKAHPNAKVAKAARKAAFKLRSSGDAS
jgi:hypothetical protein